MFVFSIQKLYPMQKEKKENKTYEKVNWPKKKKIYCIMLKNEWKETLLSIQNIFLNILVFEGWFSIWECFTQQLI